MAAPLPVRPATASLALVLCCWTACSDEPTQKVEAGAEAIDADGDGFSIDDDCDDTDPSVFPGADELCGGGDEDCDGEVDEADAVDAGTWYVDADLDGYGDATAPQVGCTQPADTIATGGDCNDADPLIHPAATEVPCNGISESCAGDGGVRVPEDAASLQLAVDSVEAGGYVCVGDGTWPGARVTRPVHIVGVGGTEKAILDGNDRDPVLVISNAPGTIVEGLSFDHGLDTFGAGLRIQASDGVAVLGCRFSDNEALGDGGALSIEESNDVVVSTNAFDRNEARGNGGAIRILDSARTQLSTNTFSRNVADEKGGAVWILRGTDTWLTGAALQNNTADQGGALSAKDGSGLLVDILTLSTNEATDSGGAAYLSGETDAVLRELTIRSNTAPTGAGVTVRDSSVELDTIAFSDHRVSTFGAALLLRSGAEVSVVDSTISSGSADVAGGGVAVREDGSLVVSGSTFSSNFGGTGGGVAITDVGTVTVRDTVFEDNEADVQGAALSAAGGTLSATSVVFTGNLPDTWWCDPSATCTVEELE